MLFELVNELIIWVSHSVHLFFFYIMILPIHLFSCHKPYNIFDQFLSTLVNINYYILDLSLTNETDDTLICRW